VTIGWFLSLGTLVFQSHVHMVFFAQHVHGLLSCSALYYRQTRM
jgi:hypothetical protein